jgi:hypothetical protein
MLLAAQKEDKDIPYLTPHDLRHTAASMAISAGANPEAVQRMLGHASAAMTLDTYADLFEDDLDAVSERMDAVRAETLVGVRAGVGCLNTRKSPGTLNFRGFSLWRVRDSNPRMRCSLIYSQIPLAAWVTRQGAPSTCIHLTEGAEQE